MGRSPCCDKVGLKKGPWTPEEDQKLLAFIEEHGHGSWRALPAKAGLQRCGKSCRLRWTNYLRSDINRGKFSQQEEQTIIQLHALLGNRSLIFYEHNFWEHIPSLECRSHRMRLARVKFFHVAQWESARLEAEARLVRESKLRSRSFQHQPSSMTTPGYIPGSGSGSGSPSTFSENAPPVMNSVPMTEFVISSFPDVTVSMEVPWNPESSRADNNSTVHAGNVMEEGFTHLLLCDSAERSLQNNGKDSDHGGGTGSDYYEDNKNYWNRILNLVNSSPI
ncbi:hypothetical protein OIU76_029631 [Salix suchowensis]|nr:hypothetical protein OIU76_029631 [Salix suchowensis]